MSTTIQDLRRWFEAGVEHGKAYLIVVCDTFDWEDYPVFVGPDDDIQAVVARYNGVNMQKIMEVYDLHGSVEDQLNSKVLVRADREGERR